MQLQPCRVVKRTNEDERMDGQTDEDEDNDNGYWVVCDLNAL
jgi:hypothetical protein